MIVLVECYHDAALVRALGIKRRELRHAGSKGNVVNRLRKMEDQAVGLLDADPDGGPPPADLRDNYREAENAHGLRLLMQVREQGKRLILINPRLEEWLLSRAQICGLRPGDYHLPQTARDMHRNPRCDRKPEFSRFLTDMLAADEGMKKLQSWLRD